MCVNMSFASPIATQPGEPMHMDSHLGISFPWEKTGESTIVGGQANFLYVDMAESESDDESDEPGYMNGTPSRRSPDTFSAPTSRSPERHNSSTASHQLDSPSFLAYPCTMPAEEHHQHQQESSHMFGPSCISHEPLETGERAQASIEEHIHAPSDEHAQFAQDASVNDAPEHHAVVCSDTYMGFDDFERALVQEHLEHQTSSRISKVTRLSSERPHLDTSGTNLGLSPHVADESQEQSLYDDPSPEAARPKQNADACHLRKDHGDGITDSQRQSIDDVPLFNHTDQEENPDYDHFGVQRGSRDHNNVDDGLESRHTDGKADTSTRPDGDVYGGWINERESSGNIAGDNHPEDHGMNESTSPIEYEQVPELRSMKHHMYSFQPNERISLNRERNISRQRDRPDASAARPEPTSQPSEKVDGLGISGARHESHGMPTWHRFSTQHPDTENVCDTRTDESHAKMSYRPDLSNRMHEGEASHAKGFFEETPPIRPNTHRTTRSQPRASAAERREPVSVCQQAPGQSDTSSSLAATPQSRTRTPGHENRTLKNKASRFFKSMLSGKTKQRAPDAPAKTSAAEGSCRSPTPPLPQQHQQLPPQSPPNKARWNLRDRFRTANTRGGTQQETKEPHNKFTSSSPSQQLPSLAYQLGRATGSEQLDPLLSNFPNLASTEPPKVPKRLNRDAPSPYYSPDLSNTQQPPSPLPTRRAHAKSKSAQPQQQEFLGSNATSPLTTFLKKRPSDLMVSERTSLSHQASNGILPMRITSEEPVPVEVEIKRQESLMRSRRRSRSVGNLVTRSNENEYLPNVQEHSVDTTHVPAMDPSAFALLDAQPGLPPVMPFTVPAPSTSAAQERQQRMSASTYASSSNVFDARSSMLSDQGASTAQTTPYGSSTSLNNLKTYNASQHVQQPYPHVHGLDQAHSQQCLDPARTYPAKLPPFPRTRGSMPFPSSSLPARLDESTSPDASVLTNPHSKELESVHESPGRRSSLDAPSVPQPPQPRSEPPPLRKEQSELEVKQTPKNVSPPTPKSTGPTPILNMSRDNDDASHTSPSSKLADIIPPLSTPPPAHSFDVTPHASRNANSISAKKEVSPSPELMASKCSTSMPPTLPNPTFDEKRLSLGLDECSWTLDLDFGVSDTAAQTNPFY